MSDDWLTFDGMIEPMEWGKNTYTILRIPDAVIADLPSGTRHIEGEFGEYPVNLALTKAPVLDGVFVYTGKSFLRDSALDVGTPFEARIRPADPNHVEMPGDVSSALRAAGYGAQWAALSAGDRRGRLALVNSAKRPDTRSRRIAKLISEL
ncbi:MAG: YdeI/OmpD-associated family protein [Pseudomonadota bacterium]